jgi:hypothetical protein
VRGYDPEVHDFVFLRDPEILKCLTGTPPDPVPLPVETLPFVPVSAPVDAPAP